MNNITLSSKEIEEIVNNKKVRREVAKESLLHFFSIYMPTYLKHHLADYHKEIIDIIQDEKCSLSVIIAFRGSGKSTLVTTAGVLWSIFGVLQKRNVVIVSQTQEQAHNHLTSIRSVLESNRIIKEDFGPFEEKDGAWNKKTLVLPDFKARISAISIEQSIRGLRHDNTRPDLIICDDLEDSSSILHQESRRRTKKLYSAEIATLGDINTKIILVGNYLHRDSLLMSIQAKIKAGISKGRSLFIPLIDDDGNCAWPEKFKDEETTQKLKDQVNDKRVWVQEYLLKEIRDNDRILFYQDIKYYTNLPSGIEPNYEGTIASIDPAKSEDEDADYTGIIFADVYRYDDKYHIFIKPRMINERINTSDIQKKIKKLNQEYNKPIWIIEDVSFQSLLFSQMQEEDVTFKEIPLHCKSKKERLYLASKYIKEGLVQFPEDTSDQLVNQVVNLGQEKHDDLADALSQLVNYIFDPDNKPTLSKSSNIPRAIRIENWRPSVINKLDRGSIAPQVQAVARSFQNKH